MNNIRQVLGKITFVFLLGYLVGEQR